LTYINLDPLRRLVSILFLIIFLFNLGGYYLVFWGMEVQAKRELLGRLETQSYSPDDLVILTIPVSLPYAMNDMDYEAVAGEFIHDGQYYKLVKQKYENDNLYIVCIKDHSTSKISRQLTDYTKIANNLPMSSKQSLNFMAKLYKDYESNDFDYAYMSKYIFEQSFFALAGLDVIEKTFTVDSPPPESHS
jgi:hypothetical protein